MKIYTRNMYAKIQDTHMYTHILTKYRARNSFMTKSFIFNIKNKSFHDIVISLVQHRNEYITETLILYVKEKQLCHKTISCPVFS